MFPLSPRSIAVIGASADKKKLGAMILDNLLTQGFRGNVFPVNPKGGSIDGREAMKSVTDIKEEIDIAVIATPAATVNDIARECAAKKVKALVVISAGFAETHDPADRAREEELKAICDEADMHLVGPNCLGMLIPPLTLNASFAAGMPHAGSVALLMQSGALAVAIMDKARSLDLGFSIVVSMGNKAAMDECDFLEIVERDEHTGVIGLYVEGVRDGVRLRRIASRIAKTRPIVLLKSGTSERGKRAVSSHTGALAGSDSAIAALCQQTGMHRARSTEEFLLLLRTFSTQPELSTSRIAIITNAGGPGVLATDAAEREKLELAPLMKKTTDVLDAALPSAANKENPIDLLGDALADRYEAALQACIDDPNVDGIAVLLTPQVMTPSRDIARTVIAAKKRASLMPIVTSFIGGPSIADAERMLHEAHIPNFSDPESALHALSALRTRKRDEAIQARIVDLQQRRGMADVGGRPPRYLLSGKVIWFAF
jgi:acetyltransferase